MKIRTLCGTILAVMVFSAANAADGQSDASRMGAEVMNPGGALRCMERIGGGEFRVLIYGNSIALHAPKADIGWTNCWGMAASAAEKDFAHLVVAGLEKRLDKRADFRIRNLAVLERNFTTNVASVVEIAADVAWNPDYVVIAIGENAPNIDTSNAVAYRKFLADIARPFVEGGAKVVLRSPFWMNAEKAECTANAAAEVGAVYVDAGPLGFKEKNKAIGLFSHGGVANHPGDLGMKCLADLIIGGFNAATENPVEGAAVRFAGRSLVLAQPASSQWWRLVGACRPTRAVCRGVRRRWRVACLRRPALAWRCRRPECNALQPWRTPSGCDHSKERRHNCHRTRRDGLRQLGARGR